MPRTRERVCLQDGLKLDLNRLARKGFIKPGASIDARGIPWTHFYWGEIASEIISANMSGQSEGWLRIQLGNLDQRITLVARPRHFDGRQWYFVCPVMNGLATVAWKPCGATRFCSGQTWGRQVAYRSQFNDATNRAHAGKEKIKSRLIADLDPDEIGNGDGGIEVAIMHQVERRSCDARQGLRLGRQSSQNAGSALSGLVGQDCASAVARRHRLGESLAFLELKNESDAAREGMLQRGHRGFRQWFRRQPQKGRVLRVLHDRNHPLLDGAFRRGVLVAFRGAAGPAPGRRIDAKAENALFPPAPQPLIQSADRRP
jgi:hypothetical protein